MFHISLQEYPSKISLYINRPTSKEVRDNSVTLLNLMKESRDSATPVVVTINIVALPNMIGIMTIVNLMLKHRTLLDVAIQHTYMYCTNVKMKHVLHNICRMNDVQSVTFLIK